MIKKIVSIKNIGRFLNYGYSGDVELKRHNLFFGENGRGKTTLCAILRSLQSGDPSHILGRRTLGTEGQPEVEILLDDGSKSIYVGVWNKTVPNLAIFDSMFISENVYSGDVIDLGHRRNLYKVIVGKKGVDLAHQIETLDAAIRTKSTEIREGHQAVQALVPRGPKVEDFLPLQEDTAIDFKISEKEKELEAVKKIEQIKSRASLTELTLPTFPVGFKALLDKTIKGIVEEAERRVTSHIEKHAMDRRGEPWLSEGLNYIRNNTCPFCDQSLDSVDMIAAYKTYFSDAYNTLRTEIDAMRLQINNTFSDIKIAQIERIIEQNIAAIEFWSGYCDITPPALNNADGVGEILRIFRQRAIALLDQKAATPLDCVKINASFMISHTTFTELQKNIETYNRAVLDINPVIAAKKAAIAATDKRSVESALTLLQATKKRHEHDARVMCQKYKKAQEEKKALNDKKTSAKEELDRYTADIIDRYEDAINLHLDNFQAGFRITGSKHGYPGGVASSSFNIVINETPVELGDINTPLNKPSFKNTLSSGDKSALALGFFLVQLEQNPEKNNKIVVFDDPFNSQDSFRRECTIQKIIKCGGIYKQVIVLSHDLNFLKRIWDQLAYKKSDRKCLKLARVGERDTKISPLDIEHETLPQLDNDRKGLADYYNKSEGNPRDIVKKIRPALESHCSILFPGKFKTDTLGEIIRKVRTGGDNHQLHPLLEELEILNGYTRQYHHGENPTAATKPIDDSELQGFVQKTLKIIGNC